MTTTPSTRARLSALRDPLAGTTTLAAGAGLVAWALGAGLAAMWCFVIAAVVLAWRLPLPYALVAPLFMGIAGWLVNMLPFVVLAGWASALARWGLSLLRERRWPRGGRWIWLPIGLAIWTTLGALVVPRSDLKHFLLLWGIQVLISGTWLCVVDQVRERRDFDRVIAGLLAFVVVLSVAVTLQWFGVPIEDLQDTSVAVRAEEAYGLDAFPNNTGMIKYARTPNSGAGEVRAKLRNFAGPQPDLPDFVVFRPGFKAFETSLIVRFKGPARDFEEALAERDVTLLFDSIGLAPANTVPRMRSFPRNALTYAGVCAALFPLAFIHAWSADRRRRRWARIALASCLFGAGFSIARGAWVAIAIGIVYVFLDRLLDGKARLRMVAAYLAGAIALTGVFVVRYGVDPLNARAGAAASINTREELYEATIDSLTSVHILLGYGTEQARERGSKIAAYVPEAGSHSTYLNYLFRTGLPGALMLLAVYGIAGLHARAAARSRDDDERVPAAMLAAAVVIAGAHAVILSLYVEPIYTLVVSLVVGLAMAAGTVAGRKVVPWTR